MATGVASWSTTAANNATADANVNWAEGQAPSTVNNSARAEMASVALYRDDVRNTGVFGQFKVDVGRALFLTAGLRGDRNSSFGDATGTAWSPMLGAAWTRDIGATTLKLRSAYGRGIRPPAPSARKALTTLSYTQVENPALEPESQSGVEGGVDGDVLLAVGGDPRQ